MRLILSYSDRNSLQDLHKRYLGDPVFELFGLTDLEFTKKRWAAGFANSCATNLGRFTDKAAKRILGDAFGLSDDVLLKKVTITANDTVETEETDGVVLVSDVSEGDATHVQAMADDLASRLTQPFPASGIGFEFRGRYGKNDDTLIQKDEHMAEAIRALGAVPVMGTFSTSNAEGAITRLRRSWVVVQGRETVDVLAKLTGFDLIEYLKSRSKILSPVIDIIKHTK